MGQVHGVLVMALLKMFVFGDDNSSSSYADYRKNNFLVLGEGPTDNFNNSVGTPEKKFSTNVTKIKTVLLGFAL